MTAGGFYWVRMTTMRIRLTRKLARAINGIDLSAQRVGDVIELPTREAQLLLAEGWARAADELDGASQPPDRGRMPT